MDALLERPSSTIATTSIFLPACGASIIPDSLPNIVVILINLLLGHVSTQLLRSSPQSSKRTASCILTVRLKYAVSLHSDADLLLDDRSRAIMNASQKATRDSPLHLPELLETILLHLPLQELFVLQRVSRF